MKKNIVKSLYSFGTAVLAFGTLATASMPIVSATTVSSSQEAASSSATSASKASLNSSSDSMTVKESSQVLNSIASSKKAVVNSSKQANAASSSSIKYVRFNANNADATKGSYNITGTMPNTQRPQDGWEANGPDRSGEVVYCYDPDNYNPSANNSTGDLNGQPLDPNAPLNHVSYNRSDLWNGSEANGYNPASVNKVAAVLYAGYPNNIGGSQHNGPISQAQVDQWYKQYCANHQMSTDPSAPNYFSEKQYEYDMTQNAIWGVEGNVPGDNVADSSFGTAYENDPLSEALYNYAQQYPLDAQNASKNGVTLENAQGQPIGASDTLTVNPSTHESEGFQVKGGDVTLPTSMNGYKVVNAQGQAVTTLEPGKTYHVVFEPSTDPTKINMLCPYLHVATADYYHSNDPEVPVNGQKKAWQNMVGLTTNMASINIKFVMSSSQSSVVSSSKKSSSSSVKSSTVSSSKASSSSAKSSSIVSSSKKSSSSSAKSSSVVSSSKKSSSSSVKSSSAVSSSKSSSSSVKSNSVVSSSKKSSSSSAKSSSVVSSSKKSSSSSVKSSSVVSSSKKSSSSSVKSSSAVSNSKKNTSSTKQAVVVGVHNNTNSGKGTGHGQGEGHGMPQTGEAVATSLIAAGVVLLAAAGAITLRKRN